MKATRRPGKKAAPPVSGPSQKADRTGQAEERLLVEAAQQDPAKFAALYEMHFERVYAFVGIRMRDRATAEDVTSEVFHKAFANLGRYEWRGVPFTAWLLRIAANAIADQHKRAHREQQPIDDAQDSTASATFASSDLGSREMPSRELESGRAGSGELSSNEGEAVERGARLFRLVDALPEAQRRVLRERFIEERSIKEIARLLEKSEGAVKQLQFRALQTLRQQMGGRDG